MKHQVARLKDDQSLPINTKWQKIKQVLQTSGHLYQLQVQPSSLLVHPSNRGGLMLSWLDMHEKGARILATGPELSKIHQSVCIEVATEKATRDKQFKANQDLVNASQGQMSKISGHERYLTLGSSHLSQFCKAVLHNATTEQEDLKAMTTGILSLEACCQGQGPDCVFHQMCTNGWTWDILQASVEEEFPDLPVLAQMPPLHECLGPLCQELLWGTKL